MQLCYFPCRTLDVRSNNLTLGGVKAVDVILLRPSQVRTHDFVGCMRNMKVNNVLLDASKALTASRISERYVLPNPSLLYPCALRQSRNVDDGVPKTIV